MEVLAAPPGLQGQCPVPVPIPVSTPVPSPVPVPVPVLVLVPIPSQSHPCPRAHPCPSVIPVPTIVPIPVPVSRPLPELLHPCSTPAQAPAINAGTRAATTASSRLVQLYVPPAPPAPSPPRQQDPGVTGMCRRNGAPRPLRAPALAEQLALRCRRVPRAGACGERSDNRRCSQRR